MTLTVAFIRKLPKRRDREELVMASDSRLTGGQCFDQGPKLFALPRSDALLGLAGDTYYAYPLALHLQATIASYARSADRRFPLDKAIVHACKVFTQSYRLIHTLPVGERLPVEGDAHFILGGYSWHDNGFRIWKVSTDRAKREFPLRRVQNRLFFTGTKAAVREAMERTNRLLKQRKRTLDTMDLEPVEVLRDIVREGTYPDVGGAIQVAKVFRHMNSQFYATLWACTDGKIRSHVFGRPLPANERCDWPHFDPDTLNFSAHPHDEADSA
jgi:hypothetical protein